jgi:hypothetical protein
MRFVLRLWRVLAGVSGQNGRRLGWGAVVGLVVCVLGARAWPAAAQTISAGPTPSPLPGSQFQGGDGNQDDAAALGLIDWQGLAADGRVGHTSDPQANDNVFKGGSKELEPGGWGLTTEAGGLTPGKDNVLDIYRAVDHPSGGDVFLYLAFTRFAGNGDAFVTFELNQDTRLWTNSHGASIPCRTTGDILISFDATATAGARTFRSKAGSPTALISLRAAQRRALGELDAEAER